MPKIYIERIIQENITPCEPNPCGSNAICRNQNGIGSCQCLPEYFGDPYTACRPECVRNSDCASSKACTQNKCVDPCPGTCGSNADCTVTNHLPTCQCRLGFVGDPYRYCQLEPAKRKMLINFFSTFLMLYTFSHTSARTFESMSTLTLWSQFSMSRSKQSSNLLLFGESYWYSSKL